MGGRDLTLVDSLLSRCAFPSAGTAVTCAVSGGPDSLALLVLAVRAELAVTAVHVDHGLRDGSAAEAAVVEAAARRFGAAFRAERVHVGAGPNLEARARHARYAVLPPDALTGHTLDDQAETVLLNVLWGAGPHGMAGMRTDARRPLLAIRRADTEAVCAAVGLDPLIDPSNRDPSLRRNRVRHELLPLLADIAGRDPAPVLARQAGVFRGVAELLDSLAAAVDVTDAKAVAAAAAPVAAVAVRHWLREVDSEHPPDSATVDRVLAVARGEMRATELSGGWRIARTAQRLRLEPPENPPRT